MLPTGRSKVPYQNGRVAVGGDESSAIRCPDQLVDAGRRRLKTQYLLACRLFPDADQAVGKCRSEPPSVHRERKCGRVSVWSARQILAGQEIAAMHPALAKPQQDSAVWSES